MVRGDVKPKNVLFDADFKAHLSYFGLERLTVPTSGEAASTSTSVGTLSYVSPEAILTREITKESDVYSFWHCVVGTSNRKETSNVHTR
jgi:serine/threonine protein kinase